MTDDPYAASDSKAYSDTSQVQMSPLPRAVGGAGAGAFLCQYPASGLRHSTGEQAERQILLKC